jgi:serpin B
MRSLRRSFPLVALAIAACDPPAPAASSTSAAPPPPPPASLAPAALAAPSPDAVRALARSNEAFALDLYGKVRAAKGNLALSPFSVTTALAMTWAGAKGETADQMRKVLHLEGPADRVLDAAGALVAGYAAAEQSQRPIVRVANRLFGEKTYAFEPPYLSRVRAAFGAPLEPVDFRTAAEQSRGRINAWVAKETADRIKDLVPPGGLDADARLVLTNAIYFLGEWATPFAKEGTAPAPFFTSKSDSKPVPTMHRVGQLPFATDAGVKVLEIPYQGGAMAMTLVLPDAPDGLDAVESRLTPAVLDGWIHALAPANVAVSLPKVEIEPAASISLGDTLTSMGMPLAFDRARADFTGIANPPNPADRLSISKVFHKAFVKMDEKGTEAAAATAVVAIKGRAVVATPQALEFKADHPFLFFLRDVSSTMILFMGRVSEPASK